MGKRLEVGKVLMPVMPIMIIPIVSSVIVGMLYLYVLIGPIGFAMKWLVSMLSICREAAAWYWSDSRCHGGL
jgi:PTS system fructose-specific IIC component/fructose-specific PTS system IIC-like component